MLVFVVVVVFQTAFHLEIYQNNVFFKKSFLISAPKLSKNTKKILI